MTAFATYPPQGASPRVRWQALGMAAAIEIAIVAAVLVGAAQHVRHEEAVVMTMALTTPAPVALPSPPKPDIPPPRAKAVPVPQLELPMLQEPVQPTPAVPPTQGVTRDVEKDTPVIVAHVPPPPPQAASAPLSADYIAKMQAAVQAAFEYPMAAKAQDFKGRARVAFSLIDTHPSGARVIVSSGMTIVDKAALRAVEVASYPPAPDGLSHGDRVFEVWAGYVD
jgi:TonB family protein